MSIKNKRELIAKDYALYVVRHFAAMQTWSKKEIVGEICRKIGESKEDVVRCKDCENWMYEYDDVGLCVVDVPDVDGVQRLAHDFCSYGTMKER